MLAAGGAVYALGVALMAVSPTPLAFNLTAGVLVGIGLSGGSFTIVIAALGRLVPEEKSSAAMGLATAAGSLGQFVFAPLGQAFLVDYGWQTALLLLASFMVVVPALAAALRGRGETAARASDGPALPARDAVRRAFGHGSYLLLVAGFFVCGFHVAFITTHLPAHIADVAGHSHGGHAGMNTAGPAVAAWALALIGLFNVVGSYGSGVLGGEGQQAEVVGRDLPGQGRRYSAVHHVAADVNSRARFAAAIGVLGAPTVPLTSGLVAVMFGTGNLGTLFGIVFFSHQVGAFLGVWLGGVAYEQTRSSPRSGGPASPWPSSPPPSTGPSSRAGRRASPPRSRRPERAADQGVRARGGARRSHATFLVQGLRGNLAAGPARRHGHRLWKFLQHLRRQARALSRQPRPIPGVTHFMDRRGSAILSALAV